MSLRAARRGFTAASRLHLALQKIAGCDAEYITERLQQVRVEIADASAAPHESVQCGRADAALRPLRERVRRDAVLGQKFGKPEAQTHTSKWCLVSHLASVKSMTWQT